MELLHFADWELQCWYFEILKSNWMQCWKCYFGFLLLYVQIYGWYASFFFQKRREKIVWAISRKSKSGVRPATKCQFGWTEPPFRANLLFGYAQSGLSEPPFRDQPQLNYSLNYLLRKHFVYTLSNYMIWTISIEALMTSMTNSSWGTQQKTCAWIKPASTYTHTHTHTHTHTQNARNKSTSRLRRNLGWRNYPIPFSRVCGIAHGTHAALAMSHWAMPGRLDRWVSRPMYEVLDILRSLYLKRPNAGDQDTEPWVKPSGKQLGRKYTKRKTKMVNSTKEHEVGRMYTKQRKTKLKAHTQQNQVSHDSKSGTMA